MKYFMVSEKGTERSINEDCMLVDYYAAYYLVVVADGIGGLQQGSRASAFAISELKNMFQKGFVDLGAAFHTINSKMFSDNLKQDCLRGSTLTAVLINSDTKSCNITHVGDSRAYIIGDTIWRTQDHTLVQELVDLGVISEDDAFNHSEKHRLTQALGVKDHVDVAVHKKNLQNASFVVCSDGLHDYVPDQDIADIVRKNEPKQACERLRKKARKNGSNDDITIIVGVV